MLPRRPISKVSLPPFALAAILIAQLGFSATYHVSTSGNDAANGASTSPFRTIGKAATIAAAGDTVLISGGTYSEKDITPANSGAEGNYIAFKNNPGTGEVVVKHSGTSESDNSTPLFDLVNRSYIWIEGLVFKDYNYGSASIFMTNSTGNVVVNNRFENLTNRETEGWSKSSTIWIRHSKNNTVSNNLFQDIWGDGIALNDQECENNVISHNTFLRFQKRNPNQLNRAIDIQESTEGNNLIAFNYARDIINHVWLDRDGSSNVILRNFAADGGRNIFNESRCANNIVQENISLRMEHGYHSAYYAETAWTVGARWINNLAYDCEVGFTLSKSIEDEVRNNIVYKSAEYNLSFSQEASRNGPHIFRNNLWFTESQANSIEYKGEPVSVSQFQSAIAETNGISANPLFTSTATDAEDFTLQTGSPALGAGDNGLDLGPFAAYGPTPFGHDQNLQLDGVLVDFKENPISSVNRWSSIQLTITLSEASSETVSADIVPVAGDAIAGSDFTLSASTVTFQPGETEKTVTLAGTLSGNDRFDEIVAFSIANTTNARPGARKLHVARIEAIPFPLAFAGQDRFVWDDDGDGSEAIILNASKSRGATSYTWKEGETTLATEMAPIVPLTQGTHTLTLEVSDDQGNMDTDEVEITVSEKSGIWLEAECGNVGSLWNVETDGGASQGQYVTIAPGNNSGSGAPSSSAGHITFDFTVPEAGAYTLYARVICPSANDDSFYLKMDNGSFATWNGIEGSSSWIWTAYNNTYNLAQGNHSFTIAYREDGAQLDKLWFAKSGTLPTDAGPEADNCSASGTSIAAHAEVVATHATRNQVDLLWQPSADAVSYTVTRAPAFRDEVEKIYTGITTNSYQHLDSFYPGADYYYIVTAVNASNETATSHQLRVLPTTFETRESPPFTLSNFNTWAADLPEGLRSPTADGNGDGIENLIAYALGYAADALVPSNPSQWTINNSSGAFALELQLPSTAASDIIYALEYSPDLVTPWTTVSTKEGLGSWTGENVPQASPIDDSRTLFKLDLLSQPQGFYRVTFRTR